MRSLLAGVTVATFVVVLGTPAWAKTMTVKGQVVDEGCSLKEMAEHIISLRPDHDTGQWWKH